MDDNAFPQSGFCLRVVYPKLGLFFGVISESGFVFLSTLRFILVVFTRLGSV